MNDDLEAIDGLCAKIIEQIARIEALEKALRDANRTLAAYGEPPRAGLPSATE